MLKKYILVFLIKMKWLSVLLITFNKNKYKNFYF